MIINKSGFRAFNELDLRATLENQLNQAKSEIESDLRDKLPQDKFNYISERVAKYKIEPIELLTDNLTVVSSQQMIPAEYHPSAAFFLDEGKEYQREDLTFHLPFSGDPELFHCVPSTRILWTEEIALLNREIIFDIINFTNDVNEAQRKRDEVINFLIKQTENVNNQVNQYNENLSREVEEKLNQIIDKLSEQNQFLAKLGTPLMTPDKERNPEPVLSQPKTSQVKNKESKKFDVFICHASEDKDFVDSLADKLRKADIEVWYDDFRLGWGDDLRSAIDNGLKNSLFGIVVFSKSFLAGKKWTEYELNGLFAREKKGQKVILPIWHEITRDDIAKYSPSLADRFAKSSNSVNEIIQELKGLISKVQL